VSFITPVHNYAAQKQSRRTGPLADFSTWNDYVAEVPPVLLVRATPKLVEGFWTKVARRAAMTQGAAIPAMKHFTSGCLRMRVQCGAADVAPIHPFRMEQQVSDTESIYEGLYVFDPAALSPACGTVTLTLYSEKEPQKADTRTVDPAVIQRIWQDFE